MASTNKTISELVETHKHKHFKHDPKNAQNKGDNTTRINAFLGFFCHNKKFIVVR